MRSSELLDLIIGAVVQIGSSSWRPARQLNTDRSVPLHPRLKTLLDHWLAHRGDTARSNLLFIANGCRINASRLATALQPVAMAPKLPRGHPHFEDKLAETVLTGPRSNSAASDRPATAQPFRIRSAV